ncbi:uncharacterized protein LOC131597274 [Vicia villosa]|uniref:uncharacterized protein LOC131597274 n=1 Tax=Vicia villosa TaxID=3911 RepID=UPI00273B7B88|nr:uncharacterized protein LOC131597274 [Vicia villosa]
MANKPRTSHARRTKETTRRPKGPNSDQTSQSSVPPSREELTKKGSMYAHNAIAKIVTRILNENHVVPGISVPLNSVLPESHDNTHVSDNAGDSVQANDDRNTNVHEEDVDDAVNINDVVNMDVHVDDNNKNDDVEETVGKDDVIADNDHTKGRTKGGQTDEKEPEKIHVDKVINLDDLSDNDLVASINPSIAKRLMRRKGKQVMDEDSLKKKIVVKTTSIGPKKSWSKVVSKGVTVPKKRKARIIAENESDSNVVVDVNGIHPKKKVSTSKLAASKKLSLERELAHNAFACEEIVNLIHEAGLIKNVTQFSKCYEVLVKKFIGNLHEDCGNKKAKDYLKVFVRKNCVNFSPTVINKFLERSNEAQTELEVSDNQTCKVITAGQVKTWPVKGKLNASKLSVKASPFLFHHKLFQGTHVRDVVTTSAGTSKDNTTTSKAAMIAMLRETCKELESRRLALEKLISSLEMDEGAKYVETDMDERDEENGESDSEIEKEASPDDGTNEDVELSSSESED